VADLAKRLPGDVSHLQRLIGSHAVERGMPPARLQRWLNAMIVTAVLDRVRDEDGEPIFLLKGGVAMELRLQLRARATNDYDAAVRARAEEVMGRLDEALSQPWNNFKLTRDVPEVITNTNAVRVRLRLSYRGGSGRTHIRNRGVSATRATICGLRLLHRTDIDQDLDPVADDDVARAECGVEAHLEV
jgi:hypothetical protein